MLCCLIQRAEAIDDHCLSAIGRKQTLIQHCQFWSARKNYQSAELRRKRQELVLSLIGRIGGERLSSSFNQVSLAALILLQQHWNQT